MEENLETREFVANSISGQNGKPKSRVISAKELGLSLRLSREALKELDRIEKERMKAAIEDPVFLCD